MSGHREGTYCSLGKRKKKKGNEKLQEKQKTCEKTVVSIEANHSAMISRIRGEL